jgi:hypothetical protein
MRRRKSALNDGAADARDLSAHLEAYLDNRALPSMSRVSYVE